MNLAEFRKQRDLENQHVQRIKQLKDLVNAGYGGNIVTDYKLASTDRQQPQYRGVEVLSYHPLPVHLTMPTVLIYNIARTVADQLFSEYVITLIHPSTAAPVHLILDENNAIVKTIFEDGDERATMTYDDLTDVFIAHPLDFVQNDPDKIREIVNFRSTNY